MDSDATLGTLLVVDDNRSVLSAVRLLAEMKFRRVVTTTSPSRIPMLLREEHPCCVLLDMNFEASVMSGNEGLFWLSEIKRLAPRLPVVLFTAYAEVELAVKVVSDLVVKPWDNARLLLTLINAVNQKSKSAAEASRNEHIKPDTNPGPTTLEEMERHMIEQALADNGGILTATATQLGISRQTLNNKRKRYGLQ